eukprot:scaffold1963_cov305-Prasinococcus_capsulatus_cf.AAC.1
MYTALALLLWLSRHVGPHLLGTAHRYRCARARTCRPSAIEPRLLTAGLARALARPAALQDEPVHAALADGAAAFVARYEPAHDPEEAEGE